VDDVDVSAWRLNLASRARSASCTTSRRSYYYNYGNALDYNMPTNPGLYAASSAPAPRQ